MIETPEDNYSKILGPVIPADHMKTMDELEKIRKELHHIGTALDTLIKVEGKKGK